MCLRNTFHSMLCMYVHDPLVELPRPSAEDPPVEFLRSGAENPPLDLPRPGAETIFFSI